MADWPSKLTKSNIGIVLHRYDNILNEIGAMIHDTDGLEFLTALKRKATGIGRYPTVSLFEAANRTMSDLVILHGVNWLLHESSFPFKSYNILYGNEKSQRHDVMAGYGKKTLCAEAFNVAPSYYERKRNYELKSLRESIENPDYKLIMVNHDAFVDPGRSILDGIELREGEHFLVVDIRARTARLDPKL